MARKRVTANGYRVSHKDDQHRKMINTGRKLRPRLHWLQVVLAAAALGTAAMTGPATCDIRRASTARQGHFLAAWVLLLITVMILAIVTPIWFSAAGRRWRPGRLC